MPSLAAPNAAAVWDTLEQLEMSRQWTASESLATALVGRLESAPRPDSLELSRALLYVANARTKRRLHADGKGFAALERAVSIRERRAPPGDRLRAWAHVLAGTFYTEAGDPERARHHAEQGARLLEAHPPLDTALLAQAKLGLATGLTALGQLEQAAAAYDAALRLRVSLDGPLDRTLVPVLAEYGLFLSRVGDFDGARALLRRAVHIGERDSTPGSDFLEGSLSRLSTVENRAGDVAESLDLAQRAYELTRRNSGEASVQAVRMRTIVAYRLMDFGDFRGAAGLLREIVPAMTSALGPSHPQTLNARLALAETLMMSGDTASVARELAAVRNPPVGQEAMSTGNAAYWRQIAADLERARGRDQAARETLEVAIGLEWERRDPLGARLAVLYGRAMDLVRDGSDRDAALRLGREVDRLRDSTRVRATSEWPALLAARSRAEARAGLREAAWAHALEAERLARERLEFQLQALPDRRALQLAQQTGGPCELLVALARPEHESELGAAWDRVVRWRGRVRYEIGRRRPAAGAATDTGVAVAHARWIAAQRRLGQLVVSGAAHPEDPESAGRFESAREEAEEAERRYVRSTRGSVAPDQPASLERVLAALEPGQALVAFSIGSTGTEDGTLGAFVATGGERHPRWLTLGPTGAIGEEVRDWIRRLATPPRNPEHAAAEERISRRMGTSLRARLWDPIAHAIAGAREVFLVGEGPVTELPWLALPGPGRSYLADGPVALHLLKAERDLVRESRAGETPEGRGLLALGDPDFDRAGGLASPPAALPPRARRWPCEGVPLAALPALPAARSEVEELARSWPAAEGTAQLLLGDRAGEADLKEHAPGRAVIHVATHGVVVNDACEPGNTGDRSGRRTLGTTRGVGGLAPLPAVSARRVPSRRHAPAPSSSPGTNPWLGRQVWLALAGANRPPSEAADENEGLLTAEEIVTLDLRGTDWVVLSACHSAMAPAWTHEGVLGMRRAFHLAGARAVIASRWPVGDQSAREWMAALYAARARGAAAGVAVGEACRATLAVRRRDGRSTHPFYWASFQATVTGS